MKKTTFLLLFFFASLSTFAQDIVGDWKGVLKVPNMELNVVLHVVKTDNGFSATMDSPDQQAFGIPATSTTFENSTLKIAVESLTIEYEGVLDKNQVITGTYKQMGQSVPLILKR